VAELTIGRLRLRRAVPSGAGPEVYLAGHSFDALGGLEAAAHLASLRSLVPDEPTAQFHRSEDVFRRGVELVDRDDLEGFLELSMPEVAMVGDDKVALLRAIPEGWWLLVDGARSYRDHRETVARGMDEPVARGWQPDRYSPVAASTLRLVGVLTQSGAVRRRRRGALRGSPRRGRHARRPARHGGGRRPRPGPANPAPAFTTAHD
jgi:hypothetical protein